MGVTCNPLPDATGATMAAMAIAAAFATRSAHRHTVST
jgi:hypothetical protein